MVLQEIIPAESELKIDEYLRRKLMPVEGVIPPPLPGIDMYGNSSPAGSVVHHRNQSSWATETSSACIPMAFRIVATRRKDTKSRGSSARICSKAAKSICNAVLDYAVNGDARLRQRGFNDEINDKTVFIIKRT